MASIFAGCKNPPASILSGLLISAFVHGLALLVVMLGMPDRIRPAITPPRLANAAVRVHLLQTGRLVGPSTFPVNAPPDLPADFQVGKQNGDPAGTENTPVLDRVEERPTEHFYSFNEVDAPAYPLKDLGDVQGDAQLIDPQHVQVELSIDAEGRVRDVRVLRDEGDPEVTARIVAALWVTPFAAARRSGTLVASRRVLEMTLLPNFGGNVPPSRQIF